MSVFRPKAKSGDYISPFYQYDFRIDRHRFHGSTKSRTRRGAEQFEQKRRAEAKVEIEAKRESGDAKPAMTIDVACDLFWEERGKFFRGQAAKTFEASIWWLVDAIGPDVAISTIDGAMVARLVAKRRGEPSRAGANRKTPSDRAPRLVVNATVNRTVTEPLRRILNHAREAWGEDIKTIKWGVHTLPEPEERVRELTSDEERELLPALPPDYAVLVAFALVSGCRLSECVGLRWPDIDWGEREITIRGKGDKTAKIPLTVAMRDLLFPLRGRHETAVFTYACRKNRGARKVGDTLPITYSGLTSQWRRSRDRSGVTNFRFHDNRHTAATRLLRTAGNLKLVQRLLRHTDIATTAKYAHVTADDLRDAMEATAARNARIATPIPETSPKIDQAAENTDADRLAI